MDSDLKAYLDTQFQQIAENLQNTLRAELRGEMAGLSKELRGEMAALGKELRSEVAGLSKELRGEMAALGKELRGEIAGLSKELRGEMAALGKDLRAEIAGLRSNLEALRTELLTELEKRETNLLNAFYSWARPMEIRQRGVSTTVAGFDERLSPG